jgi:hypothetical protein
METDWLLWAVAFLFFLPLHFGVPLLFLLIQQGPDEMRKKIPSLFLWGGISAILGFTAALLLWPHSKTWAAIAVVIALVHPWVELIFRRRE